MKANKLFAKRNMLILEHNYKEVKKLSNKNRIPNKTNIQADHARSFIAGGTYIFEGIKEDDVFCTYKVIDGKIVDECKGCIPNAWDLKNIYNIWYNIKHNLPNNCKPHVVDWLMDPKTNIKLIHYENGKIQ